MPTSPPTLPAQYLSLYTWENVLALVLLSIAHAAVMYVIWQWFSKEIERYKSDLSLSVGTQLKQAEFALQVAAQREIESHRASLGNEHTRATEQLKAQLQIAAIEHQVRFARLHDKVAETTADVYACIVELQAAVGDYVAILETSDMPSKAERREKVNEALRNFRSAFFPNRLYFSRQLADRVTELNRQLRRIAQEFAIGVEGGRDQKWAARGREYIDTWSKTSQAMDKDIPPLIAELETEFRKQLGIADD